MKDIYGNMGPYRPLTKSAIDSRDLRPVFFDFFDKFKEYLAEFTRESLTELQVSDIRVGSEPRVLFDEVKGVRVTLKNQGDTFCYLTTDGQGRYRLDPGEKETFWVNRSVVATTVSGETTLGFMKC